MSRRSLLIHLAMGAVIAEAIVLAGFYLWLHHQYTIGVDPGFGLVALILVGVLGAVAGYLVFVIRRAIKGR